MGQSFKRLFDVSVALVAVCLFSPIIAVVTVAVFLSMGRPVIFRQVRPGQRETLFTVLKFRTMTNATGSDGRALPDAQRLTRIGRFLRATSLDELPQLINVLKGDLSLVGPRPLLVRYLPYYTRRERLRFAVRPGITGWAQVGGRNRLSWDERLGLDIWYVENWSFWLDIKILVLTTLMVLVRDGVAVDTGAVGLDLDEERIRSGNYAN